MHPKPISSIAQVEGSGTELIVTKPSTTYALYWNPSPGKVAIGPELPPSIATTLNTNGLM